MLSTKDKQHERVMMLIKCLAMTWIPSSMWMKMYVGNINLPIEVSASLVVKVLRKKKGENHRAMFSGEAHKSVVHAKVIFISTRLKPFLWFLLLISKKQMAASQQVIF